MKCTGGRPGGITSSPGHPHAAVPRACGLTRHATQGPLARVTGGVTLRCALRSPLGNGDPVTMAAFWAWRQSRRRLREAWSCAGSGAATGAWPAISVETLHPAEIKHLPRMRSFHVMQSFHVVAGQLKAKTGGVPQSVLPATSSRTVPSMNKDR